MSSPGFFFFFLFSFDLLSFFAPSFRRDPPPLSAGATIERRASEDRKRKKDWVRKLDWRPQEPWCGRPRLEYSQRGWNRRKGLSLASQGVKPTTLSLGLQHFDPAGGSGMPHEARNTSALDCVEACSMSLRPRLAVTRHPAAVRRPFIRTVSLL